eukprot:15880_1
MVAATRNTNAQYIFNNFTFTNNYILMCSQISLFVAAEIEFHDSKFINNEINGEYGSIISTFFDNPTTQFISLKSSKVFMKSCTIINISLSKSISFIHITKTANQQQLYAMIDNNTFQNIDIIYGSIFHIFGYIDSNTIIIDNNKFINVSGNIINASFINSGLFAITNTIISTSTLTKLYDNYILSLIHIQDSIVNISNVNLQYNIASQLLQQCWPYFFAKGECLYRVGYGYLNNFTFTKYSQTISYTCPSPIPFINIIDTIGITQVHIEALKVTNDINHSYIHSIKPKLFQKYQSISPCFNDQSAPATFIYDLFTQPTDTNIFAFINIFGGRVILNNIEFYGIGIANFLIYQIGDENNYVKISNFHMFSQIFDEHSLNVNYIAANVGHGVFIMEQCNLFAARQMFGFSGGYNYIHECVIQNGVFALIAESQVRILEITNSYFANISRFWKATSFEIEFITFAIGDNAILKLPPFTIHAQYTRIMNSYINTYHPSGILLFESMSESSVFFINNTIESNTDGFMYTESLLIYQAKGWINILGNVEMYNIYNIIIQNDDNDDKALFYSNTSQPICFTGNVFSASTIIDIESGSISSCFRDNIKDIIDKNADKSCCYESFHKERNISLFYDEFSPMDYWTATNSKNPMIKINQNTSGITVSLYNITFNAELTDREYSIIDITDTNGAYYFVDAVLINNHALFLPINYNPQSCSIVCYDAYNFQHSPEVVNYQKYLSQLHIKCNHVDYKPGESSLVPINNGFYINHTTPYYINFEYDKLYTAGSNLHVSFNVTDIFGNVIKDYCSSILFHFFNQQLNFEHITVVNISHFILLKISASNIKSVQNFTINVEINNGDLMSFENGIHIQIIPYEHLKDRYLWWYLFILLIIPFVLCCAAVYYKYKQQKEYMNAFIVDKALVLIIAISQFDKKELLLDGVLQNVDQLSDLWSSVYNYDIHVCNKNTLHCSKKDIVEFVDQCKHKLDDITYKAAIIHVISHGYDDDQTCFMTSDGEKMKLNFIYHEITEACNFAGNLELIKLVFYHCCRGSANYNIGGIGVTRTITNNPSTTTKKRKAYNLINNQSFIDENVVEMAIISNTNLDEEIDEVITENTDLREDSIYDEDLPAADSNWIVLYGNTVGRAMSDEGNFTHCISKAFKGNARKNRKKDFIALIIEIGKELEKKTDHAEISTINHNIRCGKIRFEICVENVIMKSEIEKLISTNWKNNDNKDKLDVLTLDSQQTIKLLICGFCRTSFVQYNLYFNIDDSYMIHIENFYYLPKRVLSSY